jgi:hypothetical protein
MGASAAAAIVIKREKELIRHFRRAGATSPETAQSLSALGAEQGFIWERLVNGAVIRTATNGGFYLDEPSWEAMGRRRRLLAVVVALVAVAVLLGFALYSYRALPHS